MDSSQGKPEEAKSSIRDLIENALKKSEPLEELHQRRVLGVERKLQEEIEDLKTDRELRKEYASKWFLAVIAQLAIVDVIFAFVVFHCRCDLDAWTLRIFLLDTIIQAFGIVFIITN